MKLLLSLTFYLLVLTSMSSQDLRSHYNNSIEAFEEKDYKTFLIETQKALTFHPSHPTLLYNEACAYAYNDKKDSAIFSLKNLMSWNAALEIHQDSIFKKILTGSDLDDLMAFAKIYTVKKEHTVIEEIFENKKIHAEDLAFINGKIYLTDVRNGSIWEKNESNSIINQIVKLPASAMAIIADDEGFLWVSTSMMPQYEHFDSTRENVSALYKIDPIKKQIISSFPIPGKSVIGSMARDEDQNLYLSSSVDPEIFLFPQNGTHIVKWLDISDGYNLQGITYSKNKFFVADYIKGIVVIDRQTKTWKWLESRDYLLKGIDGITAHPTGLYAIQNGSNPKRLINITIEQSKIKAIDPIDNNLNQSGEPVNGKYLEKEGAFYYICNSPWPFYDKLNKPHQEKWEDITIRKF